MKIHHELIRQLPKPAFYFPLEKGVYDVGPGLHPLTYDFGNGEQDRRLFQLDQDYNTFLTSKQNTLKYDDVKKYWLYDGIDAETMQAVNQWLVLHLSTEWPQVFSNRDGNFCNAITEDRLSLNSDPFELFQLISLQISEDIAVMLKKPETEDKLIALNIMHPSHWDPRDKIGRNFREVHKPVPHFEKMHAASDNITKSMVTRGPFVRFVWSYVTNTHLNHHPESYDKTFFDRVWDEKAENPFYLRIERQTIKGLPELNLSLFFIRYSFIGSSDLKKDSNKTQKFLSTLKSMSEQSLRYKGMTAHHQQILNYLETV